MSPEAFQALPLVAIALAASALLSFLFTPLAIRFAPRLSAIDVPDSERRVHERPIPRTGGLAVAASFVTVGVLGLLASQLFDVALPGRPVRSAEIAGLMAGVAVGALIGYLDDRFQLRARWQFGAQFLLAGIALLAGIRIDRLPNPLVDGQFIFDGSAIGTAAAVAATTLWIVGMLNSANFVDGLDGLLAGVSLIAVTTLGVISLVVPPVQPVVAMLCALLAGSLLGFLPYNSYPARVFIGTAGVFAVGYALAVLSVLGTAKVAVALLVLGVPVIDTFWIIIRRVAAGRSPFDADRGHFHHRLLDLGLTHRQAVLLIYALCIVLAVLSLALSGRGQISAFLVIVLAGGVVLYVMTRRAGQSLERSSYSDHPDDEQPMEEEAGESPRDSESGPSESQGPQSGASVTRCYTPPALTGRR